MHHIKNTILILFVVIFLGACNTTSTKPSSDKRQDVLAMKNEALSELYKLKPHTKSMIAEAPGYAVFSNANVNIIFASFGGGYGVVKNNKTGKHTYMKMGEFGLGLGLGAKDFRAIFIFHDASTMNNFIESGWQFGGHADAAAIAGDKGVGAVGGEVVIDNITIYQITKTGLAIQATIKGTKYWKDDELN